MSIFGDLEIEKAMVLFDRANFSGAREKLEELKEQIPDPNLRQQMNFIYLQLYMSTGIHLILKKPMKSVYS